VQDKNRKFLKVGTSLQFALMYCSEFFFLWIHCSKLSSELTLRVSFCLESDSQMSALCYIYYYGVASVSKIDKIIGLFCKRALQKRRYSAKETCNFIDPTDRIHPMLLNTCRADICRNL